MCPAPLPPWAAGAEHSLHYKYLSQCERRSTYFPDNNSSLSVTHSSSTFPSLGRCPVSWAATTLQPCSPSCSGRSFIGEASVALLLEGCSLLFISHIYILLCYHRTQGRIPRSARLSPLIQALTSPRPA